MYARRGFLAGRMLPTLRYAPGSASTLQVSSGGGRKAPPVASRNRHYGAIEQRLTLRPAVRGEGPFRLTLAPALINHRSKEERLLVNRANRGRTGVAARLGCEGLGLFLSELRAFPIGAFGRPGGYPDPDARILLPSLEEVLRAAHVEGAACRTCPGQAAPRSPRFRMDCVSAHASSPDPTFSIFPTARLFLD